MFWSVEIGRKLCNEGDVIEASNYSWVNDLGELL